MVKKITKEGGSPSKLTPLPCEVLGKGVPLRSPEPAPGIEYPLGTSMDPIWQSDFKLQLRTHCS